MIKYINIGLVILLVILGVSLFNTCGKLKDIKRDTVTTVTTQYITVKDSGTTKPIYITSIKYKDRPFIKTDTGNIYIDTSKEEDPCLSIKKAYVGIFNNHYSKNVFRDTLPIDTIGHLFIEDTLQENSILQRKFKVSIKYPVTTIERTITLTKPRKAALFIGAGLIGNQSIPLAGFDINIGFQNRKRNIIELRGLAIQNQTYVGAGFKIKL